MNKYCDKFERFPNYILDRDTGIRYINRKDLESDNACNLVCDKVSLGVCHILNHFDKIERPILKIPKDLDSFGDPKEHYNRKLK